MTEWEQMRQKYHNEGKSVRQIAREMGCARETVARLVEAETPPQYERKKQVRAPVLGAYKERLREMVQENRTLPKKQRWTTPRMFEEIVKTGYTGSEITVRHFVAQVRKAENVPSLYVPLAYDPGADAQVDWGEAVVILGGKRVTVQTFHLVLNYSRTHFMMAFPSQKQESFLAGHVAAFQFLGGVPQRISYDNLKTAVKQVLSGKERIEQDGFIHFRGAYLFKSHYCAPAAGHEKGIVEGYVGFGRRRWLSPPPEFADFAELNAFLREKCEADRARQVQGQPRTIGEMFAEEQDQLGSLPTHPYECCRVTTAVRNKWSQVRVDGNRYSVPTDGVGKQMTVKLFPFEVHIFTQNGQKPVAVHPRSYEKGAEIIEPLHYLSLLKKRPGAVAHAKPVRQLLTTYPVVYAQLYDHLCITYPNEEGKRQFIQILYLHKKQTAEAVERAISQALAHKTAHLDGIVYWLNQAGCNEPEIGAADLSGLPHLRQIGMQKRSAGAYDLLREVT